MQPPPEDQLNASAENPLKPAGVPGLDVSHRITRRSCRAAECLQPVALAAASAIDRRQRPAELEMNTK
jgi:hypothetical protein